MKRLVLLSLFLSATTFAGEYAAKAQDAAENLLDGLEAEGLIKRVSNYEIKNDRIYDLTNGRRSKPHLTRIQIPRSIWQNLNAAEKLDMLHVLKLYTRYEADRYPNGTLVDKYLKAGQKDAGYQIIFAAPVLARRNAAVLDYSYEIPRLKSYNSDKAQ